MKKDEIQPKAFQKETTDIFSQTLNQIAEQVEPIEKKGVSPGK